MIFGVLKDIKEGENRVICTPVEIASIVAAGHTVLVEKDAGKGSGFPDEKYAAAGARICDTAKELWDTCDFLAKVKEIDPSEYGYLKENQMIYCCIHPASASPSPQKTATVTALPTVKPPASRALCSDWSPC